MQRTVKFFVLTLAVISLKAATPQTTTISIQATGSIGVSGATVTGPATFTNGIPNGTFSAAVSLSAITSSTVTVPFTITAGSGNTLSGSLTLPAALLLGGGTGTGSAVTTAGTGTYAGDTYNFPSLAGTGSLSGTTINVSFSGAGASVDANPPIGSCTQPLCVSRIDDNAAAAQVGMLRYAISHAPAGATITFDQALTGKTITLDTSSTNNHIKISQNVTLQGPGAGLLTISGGNATRIFFIASGNVTISGVTLANGFAMGGYGSGGGGGAAGMGGAIFLNGGSLTLSGVSMSSNQARGGIGGATNGLGGGGGGFGGNGTVNGGSGGDLGGNGGAQGTLVPSPASQEIATPGGDGGPGGGGGAGIAGPPLSGPSGGGSGGFGGGGGVGGLWALGFGGPGGGGGFGGGGGGAGAEGGLYSSTGGVGGAGGFAGGNGSQYIGAYPGPSGGGGGGGAGLGGGIFASAGTLALVNSGFINNSAIAGQRGDTVAADGQAKGGAIFICSLPVCGAGHNATVTQQAVSFQGNQAADAGKAQSCLGRDDSDVCGTIVLQTTTHFSISAPTSTFAGAPFSFIVSALDASNNVVAGYSGTVHFTASDPLAGLPPDSILSNGSGTFSAVFRTLGNQTIVATDTATLLGGSSNVIAVSLPVISGAIVTPSGQGVAGVTVSFSNSPSAVTDSMGRYSATVSYGYSGTVVPSLTGYVFSPPSRTFNSLADNQTANFAGNLGALAISNVGVFRNGLWFVDWNGNNQWDTTDAAHIDAFGLPGDLPVLGDWNGDGRMKLGVYRNGLWFLDWNGNNQWDATDAAHILAFGLPGDLPVLGDWNGDGRMKLGVYRNGLWFVDWNGNNQWDSTDAAHVFALGLPGDLPVMGDWNGDGRLKLGVYRNGFWFVDWNGNNQWDATDVSHILPFGLAGDLPAMGDWNGDGRLKLGVYRNGFWFVDWNGNNQWDAADASHVFALGLPGDLPVVGHWNSSQVSTTTTTTSQMQMILAASSMFNGTLDLRTALEKVRQEQRTSILDHPELSQQLSAMEKDVLEIENRPDVQDELRRMTTELQRIREQLPRK